MANEEPAPKTAREWFRRKGYHWSDLKKGVYNDGHERKDVVEYRERVFLPRLADLEPTFVRWTYPHLDNNNSDNNSDNNLPAEFEQQLEEEPVLVYPVDLPQGILPRIPITHDECSFNAKDGVRQGWIEDDHIPFFDKGRGNSIMVSEYMTPSGNLQLPKSTPLNQQPCEPDGDRFRECTHF